MFCRACLLREGVVYRQTQTQIGKMREVVARPSLVGDIGQRGKGVNRRNNR